MRLTSGKFSKYIDNNYSFEKNAQIAVAVSGGPDSLALIHLLNIWAKKNKVKILALIVDHGLRKNSKNESLIVSKQLSFNKIENKILTITSDKIKKKNMKEARENRYDELIKFCKKKYILHLFLAHHKDDNLETFLIRQISGSDILGLESIKFISLYKKIIIIRPLLHFTKKDIYNYNFKNKINFIEDPSNTNLNFTRASVRQYLKKNKNYNKDIEKNYIKYLKIIPFYKLMLYEIFINNFEMVNKKLIKINYENFKSLDKIIAEKFISIIYKFFYGDTFYLRNKKIALLLNALNSKDFKIFNIKSMIVKKHENFIIFFP